MTPPQPPLAPDAPPAGGVESSHRSPRRRRSRLTGLVVVVLLAMLVLSWPGSSTGLLRVATASMTPTLLPGDRVVVSGLVKGKGWQRDDVVVLEHDGQLEIKRIVGLPGDTVALRDGRLVRNGATVREPWSDPHLMDSVYFGPVSVPPGQALVFGDNRRESRDSRAFGPVPLSSIRARVLAVAWPPARTGRVR